MDGRDGCLDLRLSDMVVNDPATSLPMEVDAGLTATCDRCGALSLRSPFSWRWRDALFEGRSNEVQYGQVAEPSSDSAPRFSYLSLEKKADSHLLPPT